MKKLFYIAVFALVFAVAIGSASGLAACAERERGDIVGGARSAYLVDYDTGAVLYEREADARYPIASMVKIMTLVLAFEGIEQGKIGLEQTITVSETASGMGGSQMFLDANTDYKISDLIKGIVVVSANDASVAIAETLCGSKEAFVEAMNAKAKAMGMENTVFVNVTGLPQEGQYSTARDVSLMTRELLKNEQYYAFSSIYMEDYTHPSGRVSELVNTNKLVRFYKGCDGGKTGFTNDAMFCLSATAKRGGMRVIATVLGAETSKARFAEVTSMFNYAFANYKSVPIVERGKPIPNNIEVARGKSTTVEIAAEKDIRILLKKGEESNFEVSFEPDKSVKAPIARGEKIGTVVVKNKADGSVYDTADVVTLSDIEARSWLDGIKLIMDKWFFGI